MSALSERNDREVREGLHELARKELVRPARNSSMEGQHEYSFWHALVRDVAYGQIPRATRGAKHRAMAEWIEGIAGDRVGDHAEMLAHHYQEALQLAHSCGDEAEAQQLELEACRFLIMAGDRAGGLDMAKSEAYYERALAVLPSGDSRRGHVLARDAEVNYRLGRLAEAYERWEEALSEFEILDDALAKGHAMTRLTLLCWDRGDTERSHALAAGAIQLLEREPPGRELARAYQNMGEDRWTAGFLEEGLAWTERALSLATQVGDTWCEVAALGTRGAILCDSGDITGLASLREGLRLGLERSDDLDDPRTVTVSYAFLGGQLLNAEGPSKGLELFLAGIDYAERRGMFESVMELKRGVAEALFRLGRWKEALVLTDEGIAWYRSQANPRGEINLQASRGRLLVYLGKSNEAVTLAKRFLPIARQVGEPEVVSAVTTAALIAWSSGDLSGAATLIREFAQIAEVRNSHFRAEYLPEIMRILVAIGDSDLAERLSLAETDVITADDRNAALTAQAILAEAIGQIEEARNLYKQAAQRWADYGFVLEEGQAHLGVARCLIALGANESAREPLQKARAIFLRLGARPLLDEVDRHLGQATALSS